MDRAAVAPLTPDVLARATEDRRIAAPLIPRGLPPVACTGQRLS
jgi:hypothetical protein